MEAAAQRPDLKLVDPETGELVDPGRCPHCEKAEALTDEIDRKYKGALLEIRKLRSDRLAKALADETRPVVEALHAVHKLATGRRKDLDATERENAAVCVRQLGFRTCLQAIAGARFDPATKPQRNGRVERFDQFELTFRNTAKCQSFADRAPLNWEPKPDKIAEIAGVSEAWVRGLLDADRKGKAK